MARMFALTLAAVALAAASLDAHHSYAVFDREHPVSIEGDIERVVFGNPHVILAVRAADVTYSVEWGNINQMVRTNVASNTLVAGDHVIVTGSAPRDRADHRLSIITDIRRPADGWHWSRWSPPETSPVR
jgi:hypothetical protein